MVGYGDDWGGNWGGQPPQPPTDHQLGGVQLGTVAGETSYGTTEGIPPVPGRRSGPPTPARPAQLGTVAGDSGPGYGAQLGDWGANEGYPPLPVRAQFADEGVSVVVESQTGEIRATETADRGFGATETDIVLEANTVADYEVTVPYAPLYERWPFADVHIGFDGERIFRGQLEVPATDLDAGETTLSGPGPLGRMQRGDVAIVFEYGDGPGEVRYLDEAIDQFLDRHAPEGIQYRVTTPADESRVELPNAEDGDREVEGTPLKVFAELVGRAKMAWTVDHSRRDPFIEVFYPGVRSQRERAWRELSLERRLDLDGYANEVVVKGAKKGDGSGERYSATARDESEIREITNGEPRTLPIQQPDYTTDAQCRERAEADLEQVVGERTLSASAQTTSALVSVLPGYYYRLTELEGEGVTDEGAAFFPLTQTSYVESAGEATTELSFADSDDVRDALRAAARQASEAEPSLKRL
jgi:hypothetical protein